MNLVLEYFWRIYFGRHKILSPLGEEQLLYGLLFNPEDGDIFFRNVCWLSTDYPPF
jgi:hypothetical protein